MLFDPPKIEKIMFAGHFGKDRQKRRKKSKFHSHLKALRKFEMFDTSKIPWEETKHVSSQGPSILECFWVISLNLESNFPTSRSKPHKFTLVWPLPEAGSKRGKKPDFQFYSKALRKFEVSYVQHIVKKDGQDILIEGPSVLRCFYDA